MWLAKKGYFRKEYPFFFIILKKIKMKKTLIILSVFFTFFSCNRPFTDNYFVFLHPNPDRPIIPEDSVMSLQQGHINNIKRLYSEGKLTAAGPFAMGGGLFFLKASDINEAQDYLISDPAISAKRFNIEIHPFIFETGSICKLDSMNDMTTYQFLQFTSFDNKKISEKDKQLYLSGINLLKTKVIMEGFFTDVNVRLLIIDTTGIEAFNEKLRDLKSSFSSMFNIENKSLWIAKGTFCENKQ